MGKALRGHREKVFLMSKSDKRDAKAVLVGLDLSLKRLSTDYLDLWQFHNVTSVENTEQIFFKGTGVEKYKRSIFLTSWVLKNLMQQVEVCLGLG